MPKTFSKDSLKVGDIIKTHNSDVGTIVEVLERTMCVFWGTDQIFWYTYLMAMERGWTILPDEEEKIPSPLTPFGVLVNQAIIKNNEELIEKINEHKCTRCGKQFSELQKSRWSQPLCKTIRGITYDEHVIGISVIGNFIQSKNKSLTDTL